MCFPGFDKGQRDCVCRRRGVLPRVQRHRVHRQRGERAPLDAAARADHAAQHHGHAPPARDPQRAGDSLGNHAGRAGRGHRSLGHQGREGRDVSVSPIHTD